MFIRDTCRAIGNYHLSPMRTSKLVGKKDMANSMFPDYTSLSPICYKAWEVVTV